MHYNELSAGERGGPKLYVVDNVDPERMSALMDVLDLKRTVFNVITKSGSTSETMAQLLFVTALLRERLGGEWAEHIIATTDEKKGNLIKLSKSFGFKTYYVPDGVGGRFSELSRAQALRGKLRLEDVLERSDYCAMNAALTAEGALGLLCRENGKALFESSLLICGWGRIGKMLALRLASLGASVSVAARNVSDRAMVSALGFRALDYRSLEGELAAFDVIVNTVPARVISDAMLCLVPEDTLLLELASPPGGFDRMLAENFSLRVLHAPGLPAKSAPVSAAALMKRTVFAILEEGEE